MNKIIMKFNTYNELTAYYKQLKERFDGLKTEAEYLSMLSDIEEIEKVQKFIKESRVMGRTSEVKELMFQEYKRNLIAQRRNDLAEYDEAIAVFYNQEIEDTKNACKTLEIIAADAKK